jgi:ubiquinone biosynthesis protein
LALIFVTRTCRIAGLTLAFVVAFAVHRLVAPNSGPGLVRWYLQSAGGAFVKVGQILAMRYDLLPSRYCEELSKLLDGLPPIPHEDIVRVIEDDLAVPIGDCFAEFEPQALAAASIAQVHGARLHDGQSVVVKVIRPGVAQCFRVDFMYMRLGSWLLDGLAVTRALGVRSLMRELIALTREELDFRREARNVWEMHEAMLEDDVDHYSPALVPELSGRRTLTMERVYGVPVVAIIAALQAGDDDALDRWAEMDISPQCTAELLMRSILEQSMHHRIFHADPHAANLVVMPGGTLAWIDFGMLGWLDERQWRSQFGMRAAIAEGDIQGAFRHFLTTLEPLPPIDLSAFEAEVTELLRDWTVASRSPTASLIEKSSGFMFVRMLDAVRRAGLRLPTSLVRLYRAIFVGDIVMLKLDPAIDWVPVVRQFVADELLRRSAAALTRAASPITVAAAVRSYVDAPRTIAALSDLIERGLPAGGPAHRQRYGSRADRVVALVLGYVRAGAVVGLLALLGSRTLAPIAFPESGWDDLDAGLGPWWWLVVALTGLGVSLLGRLLREFRGR